MILIESQLFGRQTMLIRQSFSTWSLPVHGLIPAHFSANKSGFGGQSPLVDGHHVEQEPSWQKNHLFLSLICSDLMFSVNICPVFPESLHPFKVVLTCLDPAAFSHERKINKQRDEWRSSLSWIYNLPSGFIFSLPQSVCAFKFMSSVFSEK